MVVTCHIVLSCTVTKATMSLKQSQRGMKQKIVSQTVTLMHGGVRGALATERARETHTEDIPQCHCRTGLLPLGLASLKSAASARALGSRCENSCTLLLLHLFRAMKEAADEPEEEGHWESGSVPFCFC